MCNDAKTQAKRIESSRNGGLRLSTRLRLNVAPTSLVFGNSSSRAKLRRSNVFLQSARCNVWPKSGVEAVVGGVGTFRAIFYILPGALEANFQCNSTRIFSRPAYDRSGIQSLGTVCDPDWKINNNVEFSTVCSWKIFRTTWGATFRHYRVF